MNVDRKPDATEAERDVTSDAARKRRRSAIARWVLLGLSAACAVVVTLSASHVRAQGAPASAPFTRPVIAPITRLPDRQTGAGELADARDLGADGVYRFFKTIAERPVSS